VSVAVYILCALTSFGCAVMLLRSYLDNRTRLLLWSALCFFGLTINNILLFIDLVIVPDVDLSLWRQLATLCGLALLLYGLIWDTQ
jgi:uncharacterized membrane protein